MMPMAMDLQFFVQGHWNVSTASPIFYRSICSSIENRVAKGTENVPKTVDHFNCEGMLCLAGASFIAIWSEYEHGMPYHLLKTILYHHWRARFFLWSLGAKILFVLLSKLRAKNCKEFNCSMAVSENLFYTTVYLLEESKIRVVWCFVPIVRPHGRLSAWVTFSRTIGRPTVASKRARLRR